MNLFYTPNQQKRFIINQQQTLEDIEKLIKQDNTDVSEVSFFNNNEELPKKSSQNFLELAFKSNLTIKVDNIPTAFDLGQKCDNANYFFNSNFDGEFA